MGRGREQEAHRRHAAPAHRGHQRGGARRERARHTARRTWATRFASTTAPARHGDQVHDRRHPPRGDPGRPDLRATTRSSSTRPTSAASPSTSSSGGSNASCRGAPTSRSSSARPPSRPSASRPSSAAPRSSQVEGRTFPVDVLYEPPAEDADLADAVADAVSRRDLLDPHGDVLVFLPGEREIRECRKRARRAGPAAHRRPAALRAPLRRRSGQGVLAHQPGRVVILATNVAETSVTIPGIVYVIDTGVARLSRYDPRSGTTRLQIEAVSQASADQRKGRCGRVRDGVCVRLYDEPSFAARPAYTDPEIKRTGLAGVILRMKSLELGDVEAFPFLDPPQPARHHRGLPRAARARRPRRGGAHAAWASRLPRFPVDPRIARMILAGAELGCLDDVLVVAAALNLQDPRERPRDALQRADEAHRKLPRRALGLRRAAQALGLRAARPRRAARPAARVQGQLPVVHARARVARHPPSAPGHRARAQARRTRPEPARPPDRRGRGLHRALLTGLLSKVGQWSPEQARVPGRQGHAIYGAPLVGAGQEAARPG
jgi:ATP-dependent helicase HrpA